MKIMANRNGLAKAALLLSLILGGALASSSTVDIVSNKSTKVVVGNLQGPADRPDETVNLQVAIEDGLLTVELNAAVKVDDKRTNYGSYKVSLMSIAEDAMAGALDGSEREGDQGRGSKGPSSTNEESMKVYDFSGWENGWAPLLVEKTNEMPAEIRTLFPKIAEKAKGDEHLVITAKYVSSWNAKGESLPLTITVKALLLRNSLGRQKGKNPMADSALFVTKIENRRFFNGPFAISESVTSRETFSTTKNDRKPSAEGKNTLVNARSDIGIFFFNSSALIPESLQWTAPGQEKLLDFTSIPIVYSGNTPIINMAFEEGKKREKEDKKESHDDDDNGIIVAASVERSPPKRVRDMRFRFTPPVEAASKAIVFAQGLAIDLAALRSADIIADGRLENAAASTSGLTPPPFVSLMCAALVVLLVSL